MQPYELAQAPLETIPIHGRMPIAWHHDSDAQIRERGSAHPNHETVRSESLPLTSDAFEIRATAQTRRAWVRSCVRPLRISTAA